MGGENEGVKSVIELPLRDIAKPDCSITPLYSLFNLVVSLW